MYSINGPHFKSGPFIQLVNLSDLYVYYNNGNVPNQNGSLGTFIYPVVHLSGVHCIVYCIYVVRYIIIYTLFDSHWTK